MPCPMTDKAYLFHRTQTDAPSKVKSECSPATLQKAQGRASSLGSLSADNGSNIKATLPEPPLHENTATT
ncbi:hypothetical protein [Coprobacter secundus]|jgi:hypothetical protein|uniref:hypothetical protein n=1 Tax=Coprobacter secundus TaxID=1501392 RepID=UPI0035206914